LKLGNAMTTSSTLSWSKFAEYLAEKKSGAAAWVPLLKTGSHRWRPMCAKKHPSGAITTFEGDEILLTTEPVDLSTVTRKMWLDQLEQLKQEFPALRTVGLQGAKKRLGTCYHSLLLDRVSYDGGSGYVSSIGTQIELYRAAVAAGWQAGGGGNLSDCRKPKRLPNHTIAATEPPIQKKKLERGTVSTADKQAWPATAAIAPKRIDSLGARLAQMRQVDKPACSATAAIAPKRIDSFGAASLPQMRQLDMTESCADLENVLDELPALRDKTMRDVEAKAFAFLDRKEEEGDESASAPVVFLGNIPELANWPEELTTAQVQQYIKQKFKTMRAAEFKRGWYGIETYFSPHPKGVDTHGFVARKGWMTVDHLLAQYFGMFHHPRFYAVMPQAVNSHLRDSPPITRMGFGIKRHEIVLLHGWLKSMERLARQNNIQRFLIRNLVEAHPVTRPL
jgi:hypothetical protein